MNGRSQLVVISDIWHFHSSNTGQCYQEWSQYQYLLFFLFWGIGSHQPGTCLHLFSGHTWGLQQSAAILQKILQTVTWQSLKHGSCWWEAGCESVVYFLAHVPGMRSHGPGRCTGRQTMPKPQPSGSTAGFSKCICSQCSASDVNPGRTARPSLSLRPCLLLASKQIGCWQWRGQNKGTNSRLALLASSRHKVQILLTKTLGAENMMKSAL